MYISYDKLPKLKIPESERLYSLAMEEGEDFLRFYLSKPREKVIDDLHEIITKSIQHQNIYINAPLEEQPTQEEKVVNFQFVVHAIYLLGELKSENSLDYFFRILSQSDDYLETFIGMDIVIEGMWEPIYRIANHKLDAFRLFLFRNDISFIYRSVFLDVAKQVYWHQPDRQEEVKQWYITLLEDFLNETEKGYLPDSEFMGNIVWDILDMKIEEAAPLIRKAYENNLVAADICGNMEDVLDDLETASPAMNKRAVLDIFQRYKAITGELVDSSIKPFRSERNGLSEDALYEPDSTWLSSESKPYIKKPEPGRNDPCPCGSGKKYKKCCLRK
ncbi:YecA/YgfB family protein [Marinilabilia salmonicolor]|uniref:YecA/YgfB family protein n=1 Tax=Marinilabilia salmonicolor TaxID=989 RepID=UPI00029A4038|nr:DUF1186 domain-containing protein [Marinilabilia salmonicolor]